MTGFFQSIDVVPGQSFEINTCISTLRLAQSWPLTICYLFIFFFEKENCQFFFGN